MPRATLLSTTLDTSCFCPCLRLLQLTLHEGEQLTERRRQRASDVPSALASYSSIKDRRGFFSLAARRRVLAPPSLGCQGNFRPLNPLGQSCNWLCLLSVPLMQHFLAAKRPSKQRQQKLVPAASNVKHFFTLSFYLRASFHPQNAAGSRITHRLLAERYCLGTHLLEAKEISCRRLIAAPALGCALMNHRLRLVNPFFVRSLLAVSSLREDEEGRCAIAAAHWGLGLLAQRCAPPLPHPTSAKMFCSTFP